MRLALAHDYLIQMGGAERVVATMHEHFGESPLYTSAVDFERLLPVFNPKRIRVTWMQRIPGIKRNFKSFFFLYTFAFRSFGEVDCDAAWISASTFAKSLRVKPGAVTFCYCHHPTRFLWDVKRYVHSEVKNAALRMLVRATLPFLRRIDVADARRMSHLIANSENVRKRIKEIYQRDATVIHPPVEVDRFQVSPRHHDYYLILARLVAYKGIDRAIEATKRLDRKLIIVGEGTDCRRLKRMAGPKTTFAGRVSDPDVKRLVENCRALLFPGEEDFGIAPVEAQACGKPVVALGRGGALETVVDQETGILVKNDSVEALMAAILKAEAMDWDAGRIRRNAERFSPATFLNATATFMAEAMEKRPQPSKCGAA